MFQINLEKIGCGQKVSMQSLHALAELAELDPTVDCGAEFIDELELLSSIDRVGRFCDDLDIFCKLAILHAASDITVAGGSPKLASICIEYGPEFSSTKELAALTRSVLKALSAQEILVQNLHSVQSDYTYLTIAVTGTRQFPLSVCQGKGNVYISRSLGASKVLVLKELEGEDLTALSDEIYCNRYRGTSMTNVAATDITGFGLAGAAFNLCSRLGLSANLTLCRDQLIADEVLGIPLRCFEAASLPKMADTAKCTRSKVVSRCIEIAGPALLFAPYDVAQDFEDDFSYRHGRCPIQIGEFLSRSTKSEVNYNWSS